MEKRDNMVLIRKDLTTRFLHKMNLKDQLETETMTVRRSCSELAPESEEDLSLSPNSVSDEEELLLFQRGTQTQAQLMKENPIQDKSGLKDLIDKKVHSIFLPGEEDLLRNFPSFKFLAGDVISDERRTP